MRSKVGAAIHVDAEKGQRGWIIEFRDGRYVKGRSSSARRNCSRAAFHPDNE